jgi:putative membrane protein
MSHFYLVLILALAGVALIFTVQNVAAVDVTFLFWTISLSRSLLILFTLSIGFLLGWFLHTYYSYRNAGRNEAAERKAKT